jgi:hypothetical protein
MTITTHDHDWAEEQGGSSISLNNVVLVRNVIVFYNFYTNAYNLHPIHNMREEIKEFKYTLCNVEIYIGSIVYEVQ